MAQIFIKVSVTTQKTWQEHFFFLSKIQYYQIIANQPPNNYVSYDKVCVINVYLCENPQKFINK